MQRHTFSYDHRHFLLDGRPFVIRSGELHYFRIPREYWRDRLLKAKALGLNTICTYMAWNLHEPTPGAFDFSGMLDVAEFSRLAQEIGLHVILRPGPYICAEWDFGGLPAWLLATPGIRIRCCDERYLAPVRRYLAEVGRRLAGLTVTRGGPILMVQVENEYGSYGNDKQYLAVVRDCLKSGGFDDVPLFTSDGSEPRQLHAGTLDDCLAVVNFGSKAEQHFSSFRKFRPTGPLMCGEFWCGWFDQWGKPRQGSDATDCVKDLEWMVDNDVSFNIYMLHGGTNFGFTAGANHYESYAPTVGSYDYWALLDEAGRPTRKYHAVRELLARHQPADRPLPDLPDPITAIEVPAIHLTRTAPLFDNLPAPLDVIQPEPMEALGQTGGMVLYRTDVTGLCGGKLTLDARDYAIIYLNGRRVGALDRRLGQRSLELPAYQGQATLDILVAPLGRVNYGPKSLDHKGIFGPVDLAGVTLMHWQAYRLPLDEPSLAEIQFSSHRAAGPAFYRGTFDLDELGDTFLDFRHWSKGVAWVNGHNLGRFWHVGPQRTLFCPGPWLRPRANELIVLDLEVPGPAPVRGLRDPILNEVSQVSHWVADLAERQSPVAPTPSVTLP